MELFVRIVGYLAREAVATLILSFIGVASVGLTSLWLVIEHERNLDPQRRQELRDAWNDVASATIAFRRAVRRRQLRRIVDRLISWLVKYLRYKRLNRVGAVDGLLVRTAGLVAVAAVGTDIWKVIAMVMEACQRSSG